MSDPAELERALTGTAALELLREIRDELRALRADRAGRAASTAPVLRRRDRDALARILPVLAGVFGGEPFGAWEAVDVATNDPGSHGENLRLVLGRRSAHELGMLLQRGLGHPVQGVEVARAGRGADGVQWRCTVTPASFAP